MQRVTTMPRSAGTRDQTSISNCAVCHGCVAEQCAASPTGVRGVGRSRSARRQAREDFDSWVRGRRSANSPSMHGEAVGREGLARFFEETGSRSSNRYRRAQGGPDPECLRPVSASSVLGRSGPAGVDFGRTALKRECSRVRPIIAIGARNSSTTSSIQSGDRGCTTLTRTDQHVGARRPRTPIRPACRQARSRARSVTSVSEVKSMRFNTRFPYGSDLLTSQCALLDSQEASQASTPERSPCDLNTSIAS